MKVALQLTALTLCTSTGVSFTAPLSSSNALGSSFHGCSAAPHQLSHAGCAQQQGLTMYSAFGKKGGKGKGKKGPKKEGGKGSSGGSSGGGNGARAVDTSRKDFIYQMSRLTKSYGKGDGASTVLKSVNLAFYPGLFELSYRSTAHVSLQ
jgi:hypothetical protein